MASIRLVKRARYLQSSGREIPIEQRDRKEVTHIGSQQLAPDGIEVSNPGFDITPNDLITAIITDRGVARAPYTESLLGLVANNIKVAASRD